MRPIQLAELPAPDKIRPVLILTREVVRRHRTKVTVAPITSRVRGLQTEVLVGPGNGLDHESVVNCDNILTIEASKLGSRVGELLPSQEPLLAAAIVAAFDLDL